MKRKSSWILFNVSGAMLVIAMILAVIDLNGFIGGFLGILCGMCIMAYIWLFTATQDMFVFPSDYNPHLERESAKLHAYMKLHGGYELTPDEKQLLRLGDDE